MGTEEVLVLGDWMLAYDFKETTSLEEYHGGNYQMQNRCEKFRRWIANTALIDLGFPRSQFTWMRGTSPQTRQGARLDCALRNTSWRNRFPEASVRHLPAAQSDHCPILIETHNINTVFRGEKPFCFMVVCHLMSPLIHLSRSIRTI